MVCNAGAQGLSSEGAAMPNGNDVGTPGGRGSTRPTLAWGASLKLGLNVFKNRSGASAKSTASTAKNGEAKREKEEGRESRRHHESRASSRWGPDSPEGPGSAQASVGQTTPRKGPVNGRLALSKEQKTPPKAAQSNLSAAPVSWGLPPASPAVLGGRQDVSGSFVSASPQAPQAPQETQRVREARASGGVSSSAPTHGRGGEIDVTGGDSGHPRAGSLGSLFVPASSNGGLLAGADEDVVCLTPNTQANVRALDAYKNFFLEPKRLAPAGDAECRSARELRGGAGVRAGSPDRPGTMERRRKTNAARASRVPRPASPPDVFRSPVGTKNSAPDAAASPPDAFTIRGRTLEARRAVAAGAACHPAADPDVPVEEVGQTTAEGLREVGSFSFMGRRKPLHALGMQRQPLSS